MGVYDLAIEGERERLALRALRLTKKCQLRTILSLQSSRMFCPEVYSTLDAIKCCLMLLGWLTRSQEIRH